MLLAVPCTKVVVHPGDVGGGPQGRQRDARMARMARVERTLIPRSCMEIIGKPWENIGKPWKNIGKPWENLWKTMGNS